MNLTPDEEKLPKQPCNVAKINVVGILVID